VLFLNFKYLPSAVDHALMHVNLQDIKGFEKADAWETAYEPAQFLLLFSVICRYLMFTQSQIRCKDECKEASCLQSAMLDIFAPKSRADH
jgi:hypothetical protein